MKSSTVFFTLGAAACLGLIFAGQGAAELEPPPLLPFPEGMEELLLEGVPEVPDLGDLLMDIEPPPSLEELLGEAAPPAPPPIPEELLRLLSGPPVDQEAEIPEDDKNALFNHTFHVERAGYSCSDCHDSIFQQAKGAAEDFNKASFIEGKYCGACHDGTTAFTIVEENSCVRCHREEVKIPDVVIFDHPVNPVYYDHLLHVNLGFACTDCHDALFPIKRGSVEQKPDFMMESVYEGKYCGSCHNGEAAFALDASCIRCHKEMQGNTLRNALKKTNN